MIWLAEYFNNVQLSDLEMQIESEYTEDMGKMIDIIVALAAC